MYGLIRVDTTRVGVSGLSHDHGIHFRPSDHVHDEVGVLRVRYEHLWPRITSRPVVPSVTHDANHFIGIGPTLVVENQVASNRVLSAPRVSRELLIDDHHTRS